MQVKKRELEKLISEAVSLLSESNHGAPCPIAIANQLHALGADQNEVNSFVNSLLNQFSQVSRKDKKETGVRGPIRGIVGGFGF